MADTQKSPAGNIDTNASGAVGEKSLLSSEETVDPDGKSLLDEGGGEGSEGEGGKAKAEAPNAEGKGIVPERYEFKAPEGMTLDEGAIKLFEPIARECKLDQAQAQRMVELQCAVVKASDEKRDKDMRAEVQGWRDETLSQPAFKDTLHFARRAVNALCSADDQAVFRDTILGDHPAVLRLLAKAGRMMSEEQFDGKSGSGVELEPTASLLYPSMTKKQ